MSNKIFLLEKNTRNQISAGEVAERPALIIKELIENSIDAGATNIKISLKDSGISSIHVIDNGEGIHKGDIPYAFMRHATSKIKRITDLNTLKTMGFRGEALASIAAVSKINLITKVKESATAFSVNIEAGELGKIISCAGNDGTEIIIRDLFFNTPARKKFLATPTREMREIADLVGKLIIANSSIRFELNNNGKRILFSPGNNDMITAIMSVYGNEMNSFLIPLETDCFSGYIVHPNYSKPNRNYYHFYINQRYIQSSELNKALDNAYKTLMPDRRFPVAFINIILDADKYDINVHPNKLDIKFDKELKISDLLYNSIKQVLSDAERPYTTAIKKQNINQTPTDDNINHFINKNQSKIHQNLRLAGLPGAVERKNKERNNPSLSEKESIWDLSAKKDISFSAQSQDDVLHANSLTKSFKDKTHNKYAATLFDNLNTVNDSELSEPGFYSSLTIIGQFGGSFILANDSVSLYIIDQHAAHERILYNKIRDRISSDSSFSQVLVIPIEINFNYKQYNWVIENILFFKKIGFVFEEFGPQTFVLREVPDWFENVDLESFIKEIADSGCETGKLLSEDMILEDKIIKKACKKAVKANQYLTNADIMYLFHELDKNKESFTCPHGRPITIKFTMDEIRRKFLRT